MDTVFKFLFEFLGQFFGSLWSIITGLFGGVGNAFDFSAYVNIINAYTTELGGLAWVIAIIAIVLLVAVLALCVWLIVVAVKKFIRSHRRRKDTDSLVKEVQALNKEVMRLNLEKDKILSMKVSQIGLNPNEISELTGEEIESLNNGVRKVCCEMTSGKFPMLEPGENTVKFRLIPEYTWEHTMPDGTVRQYKHTEQKLLVFDVTPNTRWL